MRLHCSCVPEHSRYSSTCSPLTPLRSSSHSCTLPAQLNQNLFSPSAISVKTASHNLSPVSPGLVHPKAVFDSISLTSSPAVVSAISLNPTLSLLHLHCTTSPTTVSLAFFVFSSCLT